LTLHLMWVFFDELNGVIESGAVDVGDRSCRDFCREH
jgi:hypothetical protein